MAATRPGGREIVTDGGMNSCTGEADQLNGLNSSHPHGHGPEVPIGKSVPSGASRAANAVPQSAQIATVRGNSCIWGVIETHGMWSESRLKASRISLSNYRELSIIEDVRRVRQEERNGGAEYWPNSVTPKLETTTTPTPREPPPNSNSHPRRQTDERTDVRSRVH